MRTKLATYALVGALGLTGAAVAVPAISYAQTGEASTYTDRIREALGGLVTDGTLTEAQADRVASTLAEALPPRGEGRGPGGGKVLGSLREVGEELGITLEEVRAAAQEGLTLGELADQQGVARDALVDALVAEAREHLAEHVADGRLTQAEADERAAQLEERITARLDEPVRLGRGGRGGPRGEAPAEPGAS